MNGVCFLCGQYTRVTDVPVVPKMDINAEQTEPPTTIQKNTIKLCWTCYDQPADAGEVTTT
jgi:hypothetical protein